MWGTSSPDLIAVSPLLVPTEMLQLLKEDDHQPFIGVYESGDGPTIDAFEQAVGELGSPRPLLMSLPPYHEALLLQPSQVQPQCVGGKPDLGQDLLEIPWFPIFQYGQDAPIK